MIESAYKVEYEAILKQYTALGYVVLDEGLKDAIRSLDRRYASIRA